MWGSAVEIPASNRGYGKLCCGCRANGVVRYKMAPYRLWLRLEVVFCSTATPVFESASPTYRGIVHYDCLALKTLNLGSLCYLWDGKPVG